MEDAIVWGRYTVDFQCDELNQEVSVFNVRAADSNDAEQRAKASLNPGLTWRCTATDRTRDWR